MAAFDFDGTLIAGDSFLPFLARAVGPRTLGQAVVLGGPSLVRNLARGRDATKAAVVARMLRGYPHQRLVALGQVYGAELANRLRPSMARRVAWHRAQGHRLVIVSASLGVYLGPLTQRLGFDGCLATALEVGPSGQLTGRIQGVNVRGAEKSVRLKRWLETELNGQRCELWAYGDSTGDRELLAMADHPVRV